jgi:hypothetical protein
MVLIFGAQPSFAAQSADAWKVARISGTAWVAAKNIKPIRVKRGVFLKPGQTLSIKSRTRVMLIRGKERMQVGPNAIIALPPAKYIKRGKTMILQQSGKVDLAVNKRDVKHFSVRTPYLVAVVKGTRFSVSVTGRKATVDVTSGKVGVSSHVSGEEADVTAGQSASIDTSSREIS